MKTNLFYILISLPLISYGQQDIETSAVESFQDKIVVFSDFGFNSAPFKLNYPYSGQVNSLKFRNNFNPSIGIGIAHKWLGLRLNINLAGTERARSRFGETKALNFGLNFQIKQAFLDVDFMRYKGFAIKDAYVWNDTLNQLRKNDIRNGTTTINVNINTILFKNKDWKMAAFYGRTARFVKNCESFYLKPSFSVYGVKNEGKPIIPAPLHKASDSKTEITRFSSIELGVVPGYARAQKIKDWQIAAFFGLGAVVQAKSYELPLFSRSFLGLAPRADFRFSVGYTNPRYYVFIMADFENKSLKFNDLKYRQTYYGLRISYGYRFDKKGKKEFLDLNSKIEIEKEKRVKRVKKRKEIKDSD